MRGVQFLTDYQGKKVSALIDLKEHHLFWQDVLAEIGEPKNFQFLINENQEKIAVLLDFSQEYHAELWEDIYFGLKTEAIEDEPNIPWEDFKKELENNKLINA